MNKSVYALCTILFLSFVYGELINTNPDPNGEPWISGGISELTAEQQKAMGAIPVLVLPEIYKERKKELPYTIDNSLQPYFRPIFMQSGESCAQAAGVGYLYTYEQNFFRGTSADNPDNQYPTHYTYNFLNDGDGSIGSWYISGWDIIAAGGCPNVSTYGGMLWPSTDPSTMFKIWMNGSDKYDKALANKNLEQIAIPVGTPEGLETLKQWFIDHCDGSSAGGVVVFAAGVGTNYERKVLPDNSFCPGESVITRWDKDINHAMTLTGYNDSIRWDYNGDGKYTNDIDINGDYVVDMKDWEIGGVRLVNSWGSTWADSGKSWVMYRTLALSYLDEGIYQNVVHSVKINELIKPKLKMKATINYSDRKDIKIIAGISKDINAIEPDYTISYPYFNYQGGDDIGMSGDGNTIELLMDISAFMDYTLPGETAKIFLCVEQMRIAGGIGNIETFSIIDEEGTEFVSEMKNVEILVNSTTYVSVILPQAMKITTKGIPAVLPGIDYSSILSAEKGTAPYKWDVFFNYTEIQNTEPYPIETFQKLTMSGSNDGYANINLPFTFPFFDKLYNSLTITTNGSITFNGIYEDVKTLSDVNITKTIAACAADFSINNKGGVYYYANADYIVVKWVAYIRVTSDYGGARTINVDFAAKLYSDGRIEFFNGTFSENINHICGISNGTEQSTYIASMSFLPNPNGIKASFILTNPYPYGIELSSDGIFSGILVPTRETEWLINFRVTDVNNIVAYKELLLSLAVPEAVLTAPFNPLIAKNEISAVLSWDHVQGATIYHIYRSTDPYRDFVRIGTSTSLSYQDDEVLPGNKYFYYITADNAYLIR